MKPPMIENVKIPHRDTHIVKILHDPRTEDDVAGYARVIAQFADLTWWIVPNDMGDEEDCPDVGPYDSADDALVFFFLLFGVKRV
jgi:hypothetical protein